VASWWIQQFHISPQNSSPDLSNVTVMDVSTGEGMIPGNYTIVLHSVKFYGKWLIEVQVLSIVLALWLASAIAFLVNSFWRARREAVLAGQRRMELEGINAALELERHELEVVANHDELTGAYNRVGLRNRLLAAVAANRQGRGLLSILFMDIDHFKEINDRHGHLVGDEVLKQFAAFVGAHVRDSDLLCRWGGEEFILLCGATSLEVAVRAAERLCAGVTQQHWPQAIALSCSFGVAQMRRGEDMGAFIKRADEALYRAKAAGRNRVAVADAPRAVAAVATSH
jgi:diguanylate cyclase (GGDEF)-like protein